MRARVREVALEALSVAGVIALAGSLVWIGAGSQSDRIGELETQLSQVEGERDALGVELSEVRNRLECGAYTRANADGSLGCEMLPGFTVVEGEPVEDDPLFDCRINGNRICGPQD